MRPEPETIALGEKSWLIRPLTLRQVREIAPLVQSSMGADTNKVDLLLAILPIALKRDNAADMPGPEALLDLECGVEEIKAAFDGLMRLAGLQKAKDSPGEAAAVPAAGETGRPNGEAYTGV